MLKILRYLRIKDRLFFGIAGILIVLQVWLDLKIPDCMALITQTLQTAQDPRSVIIGSGVKMALCAVGSFLLCVASSVLVSAIASNFGTSLRRSLFEKVQSFSLADASRFSTPSLITRTTNDVMQVQMMVIMGLQAIVKAPVMALCAIAMIAGKSTSWTISVGIALLLLLILVLVCFGVSFRYFKKLQTLTDELNRVTRDHLAGVAAVRAFHAEQTQRQKFENTNRELSTAHLRTGQVMAVMTPGIQAIINGLTLSVYLIGAVLIQNANQVGKILLFSDMIVFSQYAIQIIMAFMMLVMSFTVLPRATVSARRIMEVLEQPLSMTDGTACDSGFRGEIEFRDVSFRYPGAKGWVLRGINFHIFPGETVAFIGATGSGKSTVMNLIPRLYDATEGAVLVGGRDVRTYAQKSLRAGIGYATQKTSLFSGTIRSNLRFGNADSPTDPTTIATALETAQAKDFVSALPDGTASSVARSGSNFSGGEGQRLAIARALLRDPEILIFDDAFSALDYQTEHSLRMSLETHYPNATKLIVTQRIATVLDIPRIVVLDGGQVVGIGSHRELMDSCEVYRTIARLQLPERGCVL